VLRDVGRCNQLGASACGHAAAVVALIFSQAAVSPHQKAACKDSPYCVTVFGGMTALT